jgi:hypothetical protein
MKKKLLFTLICCFMAARSMGQFFLGATAGFGIYQWDKAPVDNSTKTSGGVLSEIFGLNLGAGNETFRLLVESYEDFAPFSFSLKKFQGMGTFSAGSMAKLSLTPYGNSLRNEGFSLGVGIETTKSELYFKDVKRDWYPTKYGYIAYSLFQKTRIPTQTDLFCKVGIGDHSARRVEVGIRVNYFLFWRRY